MMRRLSRLAGLPAGDLSDAELLERYRRGGEEAAFALLVQRHGPAVLGVCRRALGNSADADDAFQATFLTLITRADSIRRGAALGCWLYGVALRVAANARARRTPRELPGHDLVSADGDPIRAATGRELLAVLDEEIRGLPEKYRAALVLCGLGERTCERAARELGWPKSTLIHRLSQARQRLRQRLVRRGIEVPAAVLTALLAREAAATRVPALLTLATVRRARQSAATLSSAAWLAGQTTVARWAVIVVGLAGTLGLALGASLFREREQPQPPPTTTPARPDRSANAPGTDREGFPLPAEALARVGSGRLRHGRDVFHLEYSPDGSLLASSGCGRLRVWEARTGNFVREIEVPDISSFWTGRPAADGQLVVVADGGSFRWFDVRTGKEVRRCDVEIPKTGSLGCLSRHGDLFVVYSNTPATDLVVYDLRSGKERFRKKPEPFWALMPAFSPDGKVLAVLDNPLPPNQYHIHLFDTETGKLLGKIAAEQFDSDLTFSPDGKKLVARDTRDYKTLTIWSVPSGEVLHRIKPDVKALVAVEFAPDGKSLVVGTQGLDVLRIDVATGKELQRFRTCPSGSRLAISPDGKSLAIGIASGEISQWDLTTGKELPASVERLSPWPQLRFDEGGKLLWVCSDDYRAVDWRSGRVMRSIRLPGGGKGCILAVSPDLSRLVGTDIADKTTVRDASTGTVLLSLPFPLDLQSTPVFSYDAKTLYTDRWHGPSQVWDIDAGKELPAIDKQKRYSRPPVISRDGRRLAMIDHPQGFASRPEIIVIDPVERRELRRLLPPDGRQAWTLALSADGNELAAVGGDQTRRAEKSHGFVALWDLRTGEQKFARTGLPGSLFSLAFSADGRSLVTGGESGDLYLWEIATGQELHRFIGHQGWIYGVAISSDSKLAASASSDAPVYVWDVTGCRGEKPLAGPFPAGEADRLWNGLNDENAANAFTAMRQLLRRPAAAVALLRERLKPTPAVDEKTVERLLRDLDADDFATREKATKSLEAFAHRAEPQMRKTLAGNPSVEAKRRIEHALEAARPSSPERRRELRAVEVLEMLGTPEARELLASLAGGAKESFLTSEARAAVGRLKGR
jgi:RNA polymerase sigma factor (sigma-70 family)